MAILKTSIPTVTINYDLIRNPPAYDPQNVEHFNFVRDTLRTRLPSIYKTTTKTTHKGVIFNTSSETVCETELMDDIKHWRVVKHFMEVIEGHLPQIYRQAFRTKELLKTVDARLNKWTVNVETIGKKFTMEEVEDRFGEKAQYVDYRAIYKEWLVDSGY